MYRPLTAVGRCWLPIVIAMLISQTTVAADAERRSFSPSDVHRLQNVADLAVSADGNWLAYSVESTNADKDTTDANLFMVNWDGSDRLQLTHGEDSSESHPRFSPDGRYLAFIAARGAADDDDDADKPESKSQVWLLNRAGGEASRLTELPGGVSSFAWSPDSKRLAIVAMDPKKPAADADTEADTDAENKEQDKSKTPKPIVIDRYQFKQDVRGYLDNRYERLYVFDLESREATLLTDGAYGSTQPAWSPDSRLIAFTSRRGDDPDRHDNDDIYVIEAVASATARRLTEWDGPDSDPVFSPDGRRIAYLRGGPPQYAGYDPAQLAVIPVAGGEAKIMTAELDRSVSSPRWSLDGKALYFLFVNDRVRSIGRVAARGGDVTTVYPQPQNPGVVHEFDIGRNGLATITSFPTQPAELYRVRDGKALSEHNAELVAGINWATVEGFDATSADGTRVGAILLKPPGARPGVALPAIAYIHGGPVAQDGFEFDATSQVLAAQGYLVVNPNYRGSNGRGRDFARAIFADWGNLEIQDLHAVIDKLVTDGLADPARLGVGGWSYGGMSTNYAIASDTRFAAAVSGASIANMITGYGTDQYIRQYENEIGLPWESIDTYLKISYPFFHADRIRTPTLFMVGEKDFNVPLINSEQMYQALRSLGVPTQLVIYPGQFHGLTTPSYIEDRLERMLDWYGRYLKPNGSGN